jgi:hypothetical protein
MKQNAVHLAGDVLGLLSLIEGSVRTKQVVL